MRNLVYTAFTSLDGVVDSPGAGPGEEHRSRGWVVNGIEFLPEAFALKGEELVETTALMFGRRSYEAFATTWPASDDHADYNKLPKYVVSSSLAQDALVEGWGPTSILRSNADVAALLYHLLVFPVLLGAGKSLFSRTDRDTQVLTLRSSDAYQNGVLKLVYDVSR